MTPLEKHSSSGSTQFKSSSLEASSLCLSSRYLSTRITGSLDLAQRGYVYMRFVRCLPLEPPISSSEAWPAFPLRRRPRSYSPHRFLLRLFPCSYCDKGKPLPSADLRSKAKRPVKDQLPDGPLDARMKRQPRLDALELGLLEQLV
jgi:hypothetical protein